MTIKIKSPHVQLALGLASFVLLLALTWNLLWRSPAQSEGRHEIQHTIEVQGETVTVRTRMLEDESMKEMLLRHRSLVQRARKGE